MSLYTIINTTYKSLFPKWLRHKIYLWMPCKALRSRVIKALERTAKHDEIYDLRYYLEHQEPSMSQSADVIANTIVSEFSPSSVVDVGCGTGMLLLALKRMGVRDCWGVEYSEAAIEICRQRGLDVAKFDLQGSGKLDLKADIVVSTEVAEHLPASSADSYVDILCGIADTVIFTASPPSQGGTDHVNEQPNEYWIEKFVTSNLYRYQYELSMKWREHWSKNDVALCYLNSLMIFQRECNRPEDNKR